MVSQKFDNWTLILSRYIWERRDKPFIWGDNDCILYAAKGVERMCGINFYKEYLGYSTQDQALQILKDNGGFTGIISKHLGPGHKSIRQAQRGDAVLLKLPEFTLGLVDDSGESCVAVGLKGHVKTPLINAYRIWSY